MNYIAQFEEKNFNDMLDLEKAIQTLDKSLLIAEGLKMYKIRLANNSEIVLSEQHARLYFPRLIIDFYRAVLGNIANCSDE